MKMLAILLVSVMTLAGHAQPLLHQSDAQTLKDPMRPVLELGKQHAVLQYFTATPCETRVQIRASDLPMTAWRPVSKKQDLWKGSEVREVRGEPGTRMYHRLRIDNLKPGTRYYYRLHDPGANPTPQEANWGAQPPWRREFAFATLAPKGFKTIIHLPVKVLLMPNVINVASAHDANGAIAERPQRMSEEQLQRIKEEYAITARYLWVNSGMRLWVDFQIHVDDRWQRWGEEPANVDSFYRGWIVCRSYPGRDFAAPGGGDFTILDTQNPLKTNKEPVEELLPFSGQIEQSFPRRWNPQTRRWDYYNSGGGTFGVDGFPQGVPARSQYLGGGDTAWLACHEFHHQMESYGAFSLSDREDERIVFNHPEPRKREVRADGSLAENAWNTAGPHGEHWQCMAYWDRTLTDSQWLRFYFGRPITVRDSDEDGLPDEDPRLPLDEKRFGSDARKAQTDGMMNDLKKAMLSRWVPTCLQFTFTKPPFQAKTPDPKKQDNNGNGIPDLDDPYPLYPYPPFIWAMRATVDGDDSEWGSVPLTGELKTTNAHLTLKHAHDETAYYVSFVAQGDWRRIYAAFDGEGEGVFSGKGVNWVEILNNNQIEVRALNNTAPGLQWKAGKRRDGSTIIELSFPNRGEGNWFWRRGGREIGLSVDLFDSTGAGWSVYEPYHLFYCRMLEPNGKFPTPAGAPGELAPGEADKVLKPGDPALKLTGSGWKVQEGVLIHQGHEESVAYIDGLNATEFDLWVQLEAKQDAILAAFSPGARQMGAGSDYVLFVGGYANTVTRFRFFGREAGDSDQRIRPGRHTLQLSRRNGGIWALWDGKPILWEPDPNPKLLINRLSVIGGYSGDQKIYEIRYRAK